jgi:uncharacterized protein (TIGR03067 family)
MLSRTVVVLVPWWLVVAVANADDDVKKDIKQMQGKWQAVGVQAQGKEAPKEQVKKFRIVIMGNEITFNPDSGNRKSQFKVIPIKSPKAMDMTPLDGPMKGKTIRGIYSLEDGLLKICIPNGRKITKRPTEFKTLLGDGLALMIFERTKSK